MANKFTTVTDQNLHLIKYRFEQFVKRHSSIQDVWHYPATVRRNKKLPKDDRSTEKSYLSTYSTNEVRVTIQQIIPSLPRYIHVHFKRDEASCIHVGDKVKITSTQAIHICQHPTNHHEKAKVIFKPHNS